MAGKLKITAEPGGRTIVSTRTFAAPRRLVFEAMTKPELVRRWWGAYREMTMTRCEIDLRKGGSWRYVLRDPAGHEYGFGGEFLEIAAPERLSQTWRFDGVPSESVETMVLEERDGVTTMTNTAVYATVEERDGMLRSGMEDGATATMDALETLLEELAAAV